VNCVCDCTDAFVVLQPFKSAVDELISGACIAMEISSPTNAPDIVQSFRNFCGPHDPEIARHLRPESIRAKFGVDKVKNAIHCTDLPEDGRLEVCLTMSQYRQSFELNRYCYVP
jgi:nucleoside-diphosphate kinase